MRYEQQDSVKREERTIKRLNSTDNSQESVVITLNGPVLASFLIYRNTIKNWETRWYDNHLLTHLYTHHH